MEMKNKCLNLFKAYKYVLGVLDKTESDYYDNHVKSCDFCSELISNVKEIPQGELEKRVGEIIRMLAEDMAFNKDRKARGCPTTDEMMNYVNGRLCSEKRSYIENHMQSCEDCKEELKLIEKIEKEFCGDS